MSASYSEQLAANEIMLPSFDLRDQEALEAMLLNFIKLKDSLSMIQGLAQIKVDFYKQKINELIERINLCKRKIQCLNGLTVAMPFISPPKFVKKYKYRQQIQKSALQSLKVVPQAWRFDPNQYKIMYHPEKDLGKYPDNTREDLTALYQLTHHKFNPKRRSVFEGDHAITDQQVNQHLLGEAPTRLKYAESLLVFNSKLNPYKHYTQIADQWKEEQQQYQPSQKVKKHRNDDEEIMLVEAPKALREGERLVTFQATGYEYKPTFKELPTFNLPQNLQGVLGGIVTGIDIGLGDVSSFAPSQEGLIRQKPTLPEPQFQPSAQQQQSSNYQQPVQQLQSQQFNQSQNYQQQNISSNPQQQQPQQPYSQPVQQISQNQTTQQPTSNFVPPQLSTLQAPNTVKQNSQQPPPPLSLLQSQSNGGPSSQQTLPMNNAQGPPPLISLQVSQPVQQKAQQPEHTNPASDDKGDLLSQIRNNNLKLRKVATREVGAVDSKNDKPLATKTAPAGGGSLMDHLKSQINKRFLALHPKQQKKQETEKTQTFGGDSEEENQNSDEN